MYSPNFTVTDKTFVLSLHYNGDDSYLFVNDKQVTKFRKYFKSSTNAQKTGLNGHVYDFSVDYVAIANHHIVAIYR